MRCCKALEEINQSMRQGGTGKASPLRRAIPPSASLKPNTAGELVLFQIEVAEQSRKGGPLALTVVKEGLYSVVQGSLLCAAGRDVPIHVADEDGWSIIDVPGNHVKPVRRQRCAEVHSAQ